MTAPELLTDPELEQVSWDLSHLLAGAPSDDPQAAVEAQFEFRERVAAAGSSGRLVPRATDHAAAHASAPV